MPPVTRFPASTGQEDAPAFAGGSTISVRSQGHYNTPENLAGFVRNAPEAKSGSGMPAMPLVKKNLAMWRRISMVSTMNSAAADIFDAWWGWPPPVLDPAGPYADSVVVLAWALIGMGVVVTAIVLAALYIAIKGPDRWKGALGGEKAVWIGGIACPGVVLTGLLVWGLTLTASLTEPVPEDAMRVRVTGYMWWFDVEYLDAEGNVVRRDANELHLPVGESVVVELASEDVIHSFWVPNLSGKEDMIPGRVNELVIQADRAGRFGGVCAEYCGGPHARWAS